MKDQTWTFVDKSDWGNGPWQNEPDKMQWADRLTGLPCLIVRGPTGALCGYAGVGRTHPYYRRQYDVVPAPAHGGLTFADSCSGDTEGVCHVVEPGEDDDAWWFGFDMAHAFDYAPAHEAMLDSVMPFRHDRHHGHYWTIAEVQSEVAKLALWLTAVQVAHECQRHKDFRPFKSWFVAQADALGIDLYGDVPAEDDDALDFLNYVAGVLLLVPIKTYSNKVLHDMERSADRRMRRVLKGNWQWK